MSAIILPDADLAPLLEAARTGRLVMFCGAGVSMLPPSRSPSWWEIYVAAAQALAERLREGFPDVRFDFRLDELLRPLQTQQLADAIVSNFAGQTFVEVLRVVDVADPNENHMLAVALAVKGCVRGIVTTNFDTLLERSAAVGRFSFVVTAPRLAARDPAPSQVPLVKIHGTAVDAKNLIETSNHKAREIAAELRAAWRPLIDGADMLVLGYSGADLNFGAAQTFFTDFLTTGGHVWWLYRDGNPPTIPEEFRGRVTLIQGVLPDFLGGLADAVGAERFTTPVHGRDAQRALVDGMRIWSHEPHIGKWSAATFCLSLARMLDGFGSRTRESPLDEALSRLADDTAKRFTVGAGFGVDDFGAGGFLDFAGIEAIRRVRFERAITLLSAAVNVFHALDQAFSGDKGRSSFAERKMNLASSWSNYGQALLLSGQTPKAVHAFTQSLKYAYLGSHVQGFLIALHNLLHYGLEYRQVRRCMRIAGAGIRIADRSGAVQPSIELRVLLATYHIDRNEIWAAAELLAEARRRAKAIHATDMGYLFGLMEAWLLLKRGMIEPGLREVARHCATRPRGTIVFHRSLEEFRRLLEAMGVPQPEWFAIDFADADVDGYVDRIAADVAAARLGGELLWKGAHVASSDSSAVGKPEMNAFAKIGLSEFDGRADDAVVHGLNLATMMLNASHFQDAIWAATNVVARPDAGAHHKGWAHGILATSHASIGNLRDVGPNLDAAKQAFADAGEPIPFEVANTGLWHSIQAGDPRGAVAWVGHVIGRLGPRVDREKTCADLVVRVDSWGAAMAPVAGALRMACKAANVNVPDATARSGPDSRFRRFVGTSADLWAQSSEKVGELLREAQQALAAKDFDRARQLVDGLNTLAEPVADHQSGIAVAIQVHALSGMVPPEHLDRALDTHREGLVGQLAFSSLARLETAMAWVAVRAGRAELLEEIAAKRLFIAEFAEDPQAKVSLLAWKPVVDPSEGSNPDRVAAAYYGTAEAQLFASVEPTETGVETLGHDDTRQADDEFNQTLQSSDDASAVDAAMMRAVRAHRAAGTLTRSYAARARGNRANWALRMQRFDDAIGLYRKATRTFSALGQQDDVLNSRAGEARAHSRAGRHADAVAIFASALEETKGSSMRPSLLRGLASADLLEANRRSPADADLIRSAIDRFRESVDASPLQSKDRAMGRLGLARALGEAQQQAAAMTELDQAIAELAHNGAPQAKVLLENRATFEAGEWDQFGLF